MKIIYLGAEVPSNRTLLETTSANAVGVSFWRLTKRGLPKTKAYELVNYFNDDMEINVYPGIPRPLELSPEDLAEFAEKYADFVKTNINRINTFTEIDNPRVSQDFIQEQRDTVWSEVPEEKLIVVWNAVTGRAGLQTLATMYPNVGISGEDIETNVFLAAATQELNNKFGTKFHAIGTAKPDNLRQVCVESASTLAWLSPMMHGETIVWDGTRLVRYPKRMKDQARSRYSNIYSKAGLDFDLIMEDNAQEISRLAVWSLGQLEKRINMFNGSDDDTSYDDNSDVPMGAELAETTPSDADKKGVEMRKVEQRNPAEMGTLPVFGYDIKTIIETDESGNEVLRDVPVVRSQTASLRMCDTCFVASNCPAYKAQNTCAFSLPVEIKTKDQLKGLINAVIEMQGQRLAFARFTEELNGGYPDPNVSQEIDRLFKLIKTTKEIDDSSSFIKMTVEGRSSSAGVLSALFGDRAAALKDLPNGGLNEDQTTKIIKEITE